MAAGSRGAARVSARPLLLVLLAFFLLAALLGQAAGARWSQLAGHRSGFGQVVAGPRLRLLALALGLGAYGGYRLWREQVIVTHLTRQQRALRQAYAWLRTRPLRRVWVEPRTYAVFWQHYGRGAAGQLAGAAGFSRGRGLSQRAAAHYPRVAHPAAPAVVLLLTAGFSGRALPPRHQPNPPHDEHQPAHLAQRQAFAQPQ